MNEAYAADASLKGKLRRRLARLTHRRPLRREPDGAWITFGFDDAPVSAAVTGAAVLEREGARGVFYWSAGLEGRDGPMGPYAGRGQAEALHARGHEIACHTFSHLDCGRASPEAADADAARNREALVERLGEAPVSFAFPYGDVSPGAKRVLGARYAALRALHPGVVRRGCDLNQLPAVGVEGEDGEARAEAFVDRVAAGGGWLLLYTHDVRETPSPWGCTPAALERLIRRARDRGVEPVTQREALRRLGVIA